jgi:hypothetical protein
MKTERLLSLAIFWGLFALSAPAFGDAPGGAVAVGKGQFFTTIPTPPYVTPQTYTWLDGGVTHYGARGPYVTDHVTGMLGSNKIWSPMGSWNSQSTTVYPLPQTLQTVVQGATGILFSQPPLFMTSQKYEPSKLPPANQAQPPAVQYFGANNNDFRLVPRNGGTEGSYGVPADPGDGATAVTAVDGFSDWAASVSFYAKNNPPGTPDLYDMNFTFANGSPLVYMTFKAPGLKFYMNSLPSSTPNLFYPKYAAVPSGIIKNLDGTKANIVGFLISGPVDGATPPADRFYHAYALIAPPGSTWTGSGAVTMLDFPEGSTQNWLVVLLMPDLPANVDPAANGGSDAATVLQSYLATMLPYAYGVPRKTDSAGKDLGTGTQVSWRYDAATRAATTTFAYNLSAPPGQTASGTLYGLFPHQWRTERGNTNTADFLTYGGKALEYTTLMGKLKLAAGTGFTTTVPFPGILPNLPSVADGYGSLDGLNGKAATFKGILEDEAVSPPRVPPPADTNTYDAGKIMGVRAGILQAANEVKDDMASKAALSALKADLEGWLGGKNNGALQTFIYYNDRWGAFVGYPSAYFADAFLNDLHFHYGYWLRGAAEVARADQAWMADWGPMVNLLAKTIANPVRNEAGTTTSPATPFLRYFDPYCGHSWASGLSPNALNQESSSEAMSAWTGLILWGQEWGQAQSPPDYTLRDLGIWMYANEMNAIYNYWFDVDKDNLPLEYRTTHGSPESPSTPLTFSSQVYSSYLQLMSDFGEHPDYLAGINWLPFHGGSLYLSSNEPTVREALEGQFAWATANQTVLSVQNPPGKGQHTPDIWSDGWGEVAYNFQGLLGEEDNSDDLKSFLKWLDPPSQAITNVKNSSPDCEVTCPKHGFKDGDRVRILGVQGMTRINNSDDNLATQGPYYLVKNFEPADPDKFKLDGVDTSNKDVFKAYTSGGSATPNYSAPQDGEAVSHSYYWIKNLGTLGLRNTAITADQPFAMAFNKTTKAGDNKVWYVAWNPGTADGLTVNFSDGTKLGPIKADDILAKAVSK